MTLKCSYTGQLEFKEGSIHHWIAMAISIGKWIINLYTTKHTTYNFNYYFPDKWQVKISWTCDYNYIGCHETEKQIIQLRCDY